MSPSDRIELSLQNIRAIARNQLSQAEGDAEQQRTALRSLDLPDGAFGGIPEAQAFGARHRAVQDVFSGVVEQVVNDVIEFRENLLASVKAHESTDDAVRATLMSLGAQYSGHRLRSERAYDQGRRDNAGDLATAAEVQEGAPAAGSSQASAPASAADAAGSAPDESATSFNLSG